MSTIKQLFLLLLIASPSFAQSAPQFSTGSMTQTVTTTQTIEEVSNIERFGGSVGTWSGDNVTTVDTDAEGFDASSVDIEVEGVSFQIIDDSKPWQLEVISREAGLIETVDIDRTITTDSVTNTLSVFSQ